MNQPLARGDAVCKHCGHHGPARKHTKGSSLITLVLLLFLIVPGIIYALWRMTSKELVCRRCGSPQIVSDRSPEGQRMLAAQNAPPATGAADVATQLEKLAKLHADGVLSVEEFQAQKQRLLSA